MSLLLRFFSLDAANSPQLYTVLTDREKTRAAACLSRSARDRFIVGRANLRMLLGERLGCSPGDVPLKATPAGKLFLESGTDLGSVTDIEWSVSHSHRLVLIGITQGNPIGVDIEYVRPRKNLLVLAERVFSQPLFERFTAVSEEEQLDEFYRLWTEKEAKIKARGGRLFDKPSINEETSAAWHIDNRRIDKGYWMAVAQLRRASLGLC